VTLDDQERTLKPSHLVIADAKGAAALAGLMGGNRTEVSDDTTDLLLEVANFDPQTVRAMRRDLGMNTDASYRFERGCDQELIPWVQCRLVELLRQCCGGTASPCAIQALGKASVAPAAFFVRSRQVRRVLGVELSTDQITKILDRLQITARTEEDGGESGVRVEAPGFRRDLLEEVDVIEEIARLYGYDNIPVRDRAPMLRPARRTKAESLRRHLRQHLFALGFHEVAGSSFMESKDPDRLRLAEDDPRRRTVEVLNPLVAGEGMMKTISLPEMLRFVDRNRRRSFTGPIRFFQLDRCFLEKQDEALPEEPEALVMVWAGPAETAHFSRESRPPDPFDARGEVEVLLESLGISARFTARDAESFYTPGSGVVVSTEACEIGSLGQVHPKACEAFDLEGPVLHASLSLAALKEALPQGRSYEPVPVYPPVRRDLSLLVPQGVAYGAIADLVESEGGELLESLDVFDLYEGEGIGSAERALGVRLVLRSLKGTLKDKRVDNLLGKILKRLELELKVKLRAE
jgi:phenylalanyl-tRNA synthetase beta chain